MNIERLRHAWARGAQLQRHCHCWNEGFWENISASMAELEWKLNDVDLRIHPADAHLEYGPLSSALRNSVITGKTTELFGPAWSACLYMNPELAIGWWSLEGDDRKMLHLFFAEILADEGL